MKVFIKNRKRKGGQFQFFMHQFVESAINNGISSTPNSAIPTRIIKRELISPVLKVIRKILYKKKAVIITTNGYSLIQNSFNNVDCQIIPMLWDVWPNSWENLYHDLKLLDCKIVFVTVRSMANKISHDLNIKAYWIPEGIDIKDYNKGKDLVERTIDIYELGRQRKDYHTFLDYFCKKYNYNLIGNKYDKVDGHLLSLAFPTAISLLENLNNIKIIICFPKVDTHPKEAGDLETLTQRYWEAMLSRCLIIGRSPKELTDLIGYDPVINVNWDDKESQLKSILQNIFQYQELVNKNYTTALKYASWDNRILHIKNILIENGYTFS